MTGAAVWNERVPYPAEVLREVGENTIQLQLFDHDRFSADDFIGEALIVVNTPPSASRPPPAGSAFR